MTTKTTTKANITAIALALAVVGLTRLGQADWPQFRGPSGWGISHETRLPVTWSAEQNLIWKAQLPGPGASSPIVVGGQVFVTCYSGYGLEPDRPPGDISQLERHVLCLNLRDGKALWAKEIAPKMPEQAYQGFMQRHGFASSTPAADSQRLYVFFGKSGVFAFDHEGRQLWHADVGSRTHNWGSGSSPVLYQHLLIVNACVESESSVALDKHTGKEVWRAEGIRESWNTPVLVEAAGGKTELVVEGRGQLLAFDPATGERLWTCSNGHNDYVCPSVVAHAGIVYSLGSRSGRGMAVRAGGRGDVTQTHLLWKGTKACPNVRSPVYHDGHLYFAKEDNTAYCLDAKTGTIVYEERLADRGGQSYASPVLADGKLYCVSFNGRVSVLAAKPEFQQLATNDLGQSGTFNASPAVTDGRLLLRSDRFLYCIGQK